MLINIESPKDAAKVHQAITDRLTCPKDSQTLFVSLFWADDDKVRSLAQNKLYWQYLTNISHHTGMSKDSLHKDFKRKFLAKILARDDKTYRKCFESIRHAKAHLTDSEYNRLAMGVANLISTTKATSVQMDEYLADILAWYWDNFNEVTA